MRTHSQNRPYPVEVFMVRAEMINATTNRPVRILVFNWNDREAVRRFAEQSDALLRAGHQSSLAPLDAPDTPLIWLGDVLDVAEVDEVAIVTYDMKQRALGLLKIASDQDLAAKWIFRLFQQPAPAATLRFAEYETHLPISPEMYDEALALLEANEVADEEALDEEALALLDAEER